MTQIEKESILKKSPLITIEKTEIILKQMKESICKIKNKKCDGTGFFCKILNKKLLITNNHAINEEIIKEKKIINVKLNDNKIKKDLKIKDYYTSIKYDTTIIEIEDNDETINYLEIDDEIFDENINIDNESIYIIQYPKYGDEQKGAVSYGILNGISDEYNLKYNCSTDRGSSGSPILKLSNQKIIGIHKEGVEKYNYNRGTLLKYPINEYLNKINEKNKNEIKLLLKIEKEDINNDIYFLDNTDGYYRNIGEHHHDNLKELNELNTEIFINNKKYKYAKSFKPEKEGLYEIKIKFNLKIKDYSFMFSGCSKLSNIDLSSFDTKNVTNMSHMFSGCCNLTNIDLSSFDTKNVTNMIGMFFFCCNLANIDLSSFDTKNVTNMSGMFGYCDNLANIDLSSFDTKNVTDMSCMFYNCSNLTNIDLSSFDTKNATNMKHMFYDCSNLNRVKVNNISSNIIEELLEYTNANIIDQFGNNISNNNYLNNNQNNYFNNNYIMNNINNNNFNNNMNNNNIMNNNMINNNMMNNNMNYNMNYNNMMIFNMTNNMMNNNMNYNMINNNMMYNNQNNNMMNNNIN